MELRVYAGVTLLTYNRIYGVGEELLFRGALWPHLGLPGTTFLFGLVHIIPRKQLWGYPLFALGAGLLLGLLLAVGTGGLLSGFLFGIAPRDPLALSAAAGMLAFVGFAAILVAARRTLRLDPVEVIPAE